MTYTIQKKNKKKQARLQMWDEGWVGGYILRFYFYILSFYLYIYFLLNIILFFTPQILY